MEHDRYESVAGLSVQAQRRILHKGDAVEKVWAAWALGLKLGNKAIPELVACLREEPPAGTRRHLIVVLAGLGERCVLLNLAERDPDDLVRATACQYAIRTADPEDKRIQQILARRLECERAPVVRELILREAGERFPWLKSADTGMAEQRL